MSKKVIILRKKDSNIFTIYWCELILKRPLLLRVPLNRLRIPQTIMIQILIQPLSQRIKDMPKAVIIAICGSCLPKVRLIEPIVRNQTLRAPEAPNYRVISKSRKLASGVPSNEPDWIVSRSSCPRSNNLDHFRLLILLRRLVGQFAWFLVCEDNRPSVIGLLTSELLARLTLASEIVPMSRFMADLRIVAPFCVISRFLVEGKLELLTEIYF